MTSRMTGLFAALLLIASACSSGNALSLEVGDCFDDPEGLDGTQVQEFFDVPVVDCASPHDNEVYALVTYSGGAAYPGDTAFTEFAIDACYDQFERYVGITYEVSILDYWFIWPNEEAYDAGERKVTCALYHVDFDKLTGSMRNSGV